MRYLVLLIALFIVSCDESPSYHASGPQRDPALPAPPHEETGPELVESGKVLEIAFRLGSTTSTTNQAMGYQKTISKSWVDDPLGLHNKTVNVPGTSATSTVKIEDQFAVVFECQHGKFLIEDLGRDSRAGKLWKKLKQGDEVKIRYKEIFHVIPAENKKTVVSYEFIDADPTKAGS